MADTIRRVLVVDDEEPIRRALIRTLAINGFETREAADGLSAWGLSMSQHFDLLVTDVRMPGLDGMELVNRVTQFNPAIRILLISAYLPIGFPSPHMFMRKPFTQEEFMATVRLVLPMPPEGSA